MTNLVNGKVSLKFKNSVLVQKSSSSLKSNFILNLYIVYELNNWPRNPTYMFSTKKLSIWHSQITKKRNKKSI